ncbi:sugar-binding domain-containing protein [Sphingobacterium sp. LRF_L2]|uniref:sugar-binding domain-containing protein n=1 Tax=Sphingobacterium sp. LRF_L2 TaxID=3369421 RepID=UPI003F5DD2E9
MHKRSIIFTFLLISICLLVNQIAVYGQPDRGDKRKVLFDDNWRFTLGDVTNASQTSFDDHSWRKLDLPHDWSIEGNVNPKNPSGNDGGYFPTGIGWYRKNLYVDKSQQGKNLQLYFEGIYMNAEIYVNGQLAGARPYGYSSFQIDITPHLHYGKQNIIAVKVDNAQQKNCRWYSGSGIYRHVYLITTPKINFTTWGTFISTADVDKDQASIHVATELQNKTNGAKKLQLHYEIFDQQQQLVAQERQEITLPPSSNEIKEKDIAIKQVKLWSPESPHLYSARLRILEGTKLIDQQTIPFGVRTISYSAEDGFKLNGKMIKINGGCVHHDNGALGAAAYDRAEYRKAEILKKAGFNAVRTSHNPPSEAFLEACDQLGLLVMDESFDGWRTGKNPHDYATIFDKWWKQDITSMVLRDRNHPAIVFWSTGNEIIERKEAQAVTTAGDLAKLVRSLDPSRPVTSAITTWDKDWEIFDPLFAQHDIGGYNYQLHRAPSDHQRVPSRVIVQTESYPRDAFANWKLVNDNNYIIGDFVWTAMDYLGESGIGRYYYAGETEGQHYERDIYPWHGAYCGDIDLIGQRKPISHYRDLLYNDNKKLYMAVKEPNHYFGEIKETLWSVWPTWESWTWPGHDGKDIEVEVYSRYPAVRLYINEQLIAEKTTAANSEFKASFTVPYQPGKIRAVGVVQGKEVDEYVLTSSGEAQQIRLIADRENIKADGQDLSFINVEVADATGILNPHAANRITFSIEGTGSIIAVDNANLQDEDNYTDKSRKAWKGRAMLVVKSSKEKGNIRIKATADGLKAATINIQSQ